MTSEDLEEIRDSLSFIDAEAAGFLYCEHVWGLLELVDQQGRELEAISKEWASYQEASCTLNELKNETIQWLRERLREFKGQLEECQHGLEGA